MLTTTATELPHLMQCIGSRNMPSPVPNGGDQTQRDEGNAAHWLAEQMYEHGAEHKWAGQVAPNGHVVTDDMVEHVSEYVMALDCGEMETDTSYGDEGWEIRGRADHLVYRQGGDSALHTLTVDDFKYGWRLVSPVRNWTLLSHAIGWCIRNNTRADRIVLRIHQPRPYHPDGPLREWSCSYDELMGYYTQIAARLSNPSDELATGDMCAKCHARFDCRALDASIYNALDVVQMPFNDSLPKSVMLDEYALFERAAEIIKIGKEAREELISHRIKMGETFKGYSLERRYGNRRWKPGLSGKMLSAAAGVDLTLDGLVTPAEAVRRGMSEEVKEMLVDRPLLEPKLKRIDADAKARAVFGEP